MVFVAPLCTLGRIARLGTEVHMTRFYRHRFVASSCVLVLLLSVTYVTLVHAEMDPTPLLQQALRFRVTVHKNRRTGSMTAAYHCRHAVGGCDQRLFEFARYLKEAGERNGIDPWLLAAMAFRESGLNPFAVGGVGELGILQLHPKNPRSKGVRFVKDEWYRLRCRKQPGACQREVVDRAAELLARSIQQCGGDLEKALGAYNTGRCGGNRDYTQRILAEREVLKSAVGLPIEELAQASQNTLAQH